MVGRPSAAPHADSPAELDIKKRSLAKAKLLSCRIPQTPANRRSERELAGATTGDDQTNHREASQSEGAGLGDY